MNSDVRSADKLIHTAQIYARAAEDALNIGTPGHGEVAVALATMSTAHSSLALALIAQREATFHGY